MLKGAQKQMIVIRTGDSRYFDEAYFVLRRELPGGEHEDMIREANLILYQNQPAERAKPRRRHLGLWCFLGGLLLGAVGALLLCLLIL